MIQVQYTLCTLMYRGDFTHDPGTAQFIYSHVQTFFSYQRCHFRERGMNNVVGNKM